MQENQTEPQRVKTILTLSPGVMCVAVQRAQKSGYRLHDWLDRVVLEACQREVQARDEEANFEREFVDFYCSIANRTPDLFFGRWRILYEHAQLRKDLWDAPIIFEDEFPPPRSRHFRLNPHRLYLAWPSLYCAAFGV